MKGLENSRLDQVKNWSLLRHYKQAVAFTAPHAVNYKQQRQTDLRGEQNTGGEIPSFNG